MQAGWAATSLGAVWLLGAAAQKGLDQRGRLRAAASGDAQAASGDAQQPAKPGAEGAAQRRAIAREP